MSGRIEIRYLSIEWLRPGAAVRVDVSDDPIPVEIDADGCLTAEAHVFHDHHPWIGLRFEDEIENDRATILEGGGEYVPMMPVVDPAGRRWWIAAGRWDQSNRRHLSSMQRSMGRRDILVGGTRIVLDVILNDAGRTRIEDYLRDFRNGLEWLALDAGSDAVSAVHDDLAGPERIASALAAFLRDASAIAARPAMDVREFAELQPRSRLRPSPATFRAMAGRPTAPAYPGRGVEETPDIPDNRVVRQMVRIAGSVASRASAALADKASKAAVLASLDDGTATDVSVVPVDRSEFEEQLSRMERMSAAFARYGSPEAFGPDERLVERTFRTNGPFVSRNGGDPGFWCADVEPGTSEVLIVPEDLRLLLTQAGCKGRRIVVRGRCRIDEPRPGRKAMRFTKFSAVRSVSIDDRDLIAKRDRRDRLEHAGWTRTPSKAEREAMAEEASAAGRRRDHGRSRSEAAVRISGHLAEIASEADRIDLIMTKKGIAASSSPPAGMRWSRSPAYVSALSSFRKATASTFENDGADDERRMGVLHASAVYERWCLLRIVAVLVEELRFAPEEEWRRIVVSASTGGGRGGTLRLRRDDVSLSAELDIQKPFPDGRTPDFVLRFAYDGEAAGRPLVMDAKFRTAWRRGELATLLEELVSFKDYGRSGGRVFILHPVPGSQPGRTSPLPWGEHCDYGHRDAGGHRKGSILLAPDRKGMAGGIHLKRLLVMHLQSSFARWDELARDDPDVSTGKIFCISCGSSNAPQDAGVRVRCGGCGFFSKATRCVGCHRPFRKNGLSMIYQAVQADNIGNVACAECGTGL